MKKMWYTERMECYSTIKKNEILPFVTTWMDLEGIMLSKIEIDKERQILHDITYMWNLFFKKSETHRNRE